MKHSRVFELVGRLGVFESLLDVQVGVELVEIVEERTVSIPVKTRIGAHRSLFEKQ